MEHKDLFYGAAFYHLDAPIIIYDAELETVVDVNASALQNLKARAADVINQRVESIPKVNLCGTEAPEMYQVKPDTIKRVVGTDFDVKVIGAFTFKGRKYITSILVIGNDGV